MPLELNLSSYYNQRMFIGDSRAEKVLAKAINSTPEDLETLKEDVDILLNTSGLVLPEKSAVSQLKLRWAKIKFNMAMFFSRTFRHKFHKAVKTLCEIQAKVLQDRSRKFLDVAEQERFQEITARALEEENTARAAKVSELKDKIAALETSIQHRQEEKSKASEITAKTEKKFTSLSKIFDETSQAKIALTTRANKLKAFMPLLEAGMQDWTPWSAQLSLRDKLRESYQEIKLDSEPERDFGLQFNNTKAKELLDSVTHELTTIPQKNAILDDALADLTAKLSAVETNKILAQTEVDTIQKKIEVLEIQKERIGSDLRVLEPVPSAPRRSVVYAAPPEEEFVIEAQAPHRVQSKKDELLQILRNSDQKFSTLFDYLLKPGLVKDFQFNAKSAEYTVELDNVQRLWVPSSDIGGGVIMTLGEKRERLFKFTLKNGEMQINQDYGIDSYGNFSFATKNAVITKLKPNGSKIDSTGKALGVSQTKSVSFDEMQTAWKNGKIIPNPEPKYDKNGKLMPVASDAHFKGFWGKNDKNKYDWQK